MAATPRPPAAKFGWLVIPLALAPIGLAVRPMDGPWFFVVAISICFAAPAAGFWWGEMRGGPSARKAALGCIGTLTLFGFYLLWALIGARLFFR